MHGKRLPSIGMLFRKDKSGNYEKNALLLQDILLYKLHNENNNSFKIWDLTRWLLKNNLEFYNYYRGPFSSYTTTVSNKIEARIDRVKARIEDLIDLRLIHQNGTAKATKGNATISLYGYTELGHFVALFIRDMRPDRHKARLNEQIYDLFNTRFHKFPSSVEAFSSIFYRRCQDVGLFGQIASVCKNILESELKIHSIQDLFEHLIILPFNKNISSATTKNLWNLWKESFNQLDPNLQELFLYRIKLFLERQIEEKVKSFSEYERLRFRFRHDVHVIVIEEQCKQCNFSTIKDFDILTYLDKLNLSPYEPLVASKCPKCKELMLRRS